MEESNSLFSDAFKGGFGWEVLKVLRGPPRVTFTWRHWGKFDGEFRGREGTGETFEMYGMNVATVDEKGKIVKVEVFFDADSFLLALEGKNSAEDLSTGEAIMGNDFRMTAVDKIDKGKTTEMRG